MKVYVWKHSGNSYKLRVLLALIGVEYEEVMVNFRTHEHKSADYRKINPRGQVPALVDGEMVLWDSAACLVYIARKFGGEQWLPSAPAPMAEVMNWVSLAGNEMLYGLQYARRGLTRGICSAGTVEQMQVNGRIALDVVEARLATQDWLALGHPSIADIACFPYVETAPEGGMPLAPYPRITAWLARCKALPQWPARWQT
jgi:glutathione S-transferase